MPLFSNTITVLFDGKQQIKYVGGAVKEEKQIYAQLHVPVSITKDTVKLHKYVLKRITANYGNEYVIFGDVHVVNPDGSFNTTNLYCEPDLIKYEVPKKYKEIKDEKRNGMSNLESKFWKWYEGGSK